MVSDLEVTALLRHWRFPVGGRVNGAQLGGGLAPTGVACALCRPISGATVVNRRSSRLRQVPALSQGLAGRALVLALGRVDASGP